MKIYHLPTRKSQDDDYKRPSIEIPRTLSTLKFLYILPTVMIQPKPTTKPQNFQFKKSK